MGKAKAKVTRSTSQPQKGSAQSHFQAIVNECDVMAQANPPYALSGGHVTPAPSHGPYDCSSAVSRVLQVAGYNIPTMDSTGFMSWGDPGPGQVTIWAGTDHVFLMFANKCWAWSCPGCQNGWQPLDNYGDPQNPSTSGPYVARHPADLGGPAAQIIGGTNGNSTTTSTGSVSLAGVESTAKASAFATYLQLPGILDQAESMALKGVRSLMNDQPLLPFVEQLCQASLRRFQSMPNGNFFAFYPDYFGGMNHRTPYWQINDIEILDGQINLSDEALATHVYVVGDTVGLYDGVNVEDEVASAGVVTLFEAMAANFITGLDKEGHGIPTPKSKTALNTKNEVINFLQKYGARPYFEEAPMVRSGFYEMFLAFQRFCMLWSQQFLTQFTFTYMPELFPGGLIALPDHGLQFFVEEVEHDFDYENGFTTTAMLSSPTALEGSNGPPGIHEGMIRAGALDPTSKQ